MTLKELQDKRATIHASMESILAKADANETPGVLTDEQDAEYNALDAQFDATETAIKRMEALANKKRTMAAVVDHNAGMVIPGETLDEDELDYSAMTPDDIVSNGPVIAKLPDRGFKGIGEFATLVYEAKGAVPMDPRFQMLAAITGMNQSTGSDGGFTVPPAFSTAIWDGLNTGADSLMSMTDNYTVEGDSLTFNANAETSRATGSRYGGVRAYWVAEAIAPTVSKVKFRQLKLEPHEIACLVPMTNKLLRNSQVAIEQYVERACIEEMNFIIGDSIVNGDGAGKPTGFVGASGTVSVAKEAGQAAATIEKENIDKMWSRNHARARSGAVWFINQDCEPALEKLSAVVGTGGVPVYLPAGGVTDTPNARLKGRPVMPIEYCATLGTVGDIALANLNYYAMGTQGTTETAISMHFRFDVAETMLRVSWAVDGQPWLASALTPFKGSNTLSPMVTLATRA